MSLAVADLTQAAMSEIYFNATHSNMPDLIAPITLKPQ